LDVPANSGREGDVCPDEKFIDPRGVNDKSAGLTDGEIVVGDGAAREMSKSKSFGGGEVGLLEADNVGFFDESPESIEDLTFASQTRLRGGVVGKAVDIVREEVWGASNRRGERKVGAGESGISRGVRRRPKRVGCRRSGARSVPRRGGGGEDGRLRKLIVGERENRRGRKVLVQIFRTMVDVGQGGARSVSRSGGGEEGGRLTVLVEGEREKRRARTDLVQIFRTMVEVVQGGAHSFSRRGGGGGWSVDNVGRGGERKKKSQDGPGPNFSGEG